MADSIRSPDKDARLPFAKPSATLLYQRFSDFMWLAEQLQVIRASVF